MNSKLIFLDIDGTIYDSSIGVSEETKNAISLARKNGHQVFICTGRPKCEIMDEIKAIPFDGFIYASGAHIEINSKEIFLTEIPKLEVETLIKELKSSEYGILVQTVEKCYFNQKGKDILEKVFFSKFTNSELKRFKSLEENVYVDIKTFTPEKNRVLKFLILSSTQKSLEILQEKYNPKYDLIIYDKNKRKKDSVFNGELMQLNINKATGIEKVLSYLEKSQKDTICFGDSRNDLEMIKFCEIGICMENGENALKEIADQICPSVKENGVSKAFAKLNLI